MGVELCFCAMQPQTLLFAFLYLYPTIVFGSVVKSMVNQDALLVGSCILSRCVFVVSLLCFSTHTINGLGHFNQMILLSLVSCILEPFSTQQQSIFTMMNPTKIMQDIKLNSSDKFTSQPIFKSLSLIIYKYVKWLFIQCKFRARLLFVRIKCIF